jgi:hypothetical protein
MLSCSNPDIKIGPAAIHISMQEIKQGIAWDGFSFLVKVSGGLFRGDQSFPSHMGLLR